jgi:hypothetical protein
MIASKLLDSTLGIFLDFHKTLKFRKFHGKWVLFVHFKADYAKNQAFGQFLNYIIFNLSARLLVSSYNLF